MAFKIDELRKKAPSGWKAKFDKITKGVKDFARGLLKSVSEGFSAGKKAAEGSKPSNKPVESEKGQAEPTSSKERAGKKIGHLVTPEEYKTAIVEALVAIAAKMGHEVSSEEAEAFIEENTGGEDLIKDDPDSQKLIEDMVMGMAKASESPLWTGMTREQASQLIAIQLAKKPWGKPLVEVDPTGRRLDGVDDRKYSDLSPAEKRLKEVELIVRARNAGTNMTHEQAAAYLAQAIPVKKGEQAQGDNPRKTTETGARKSFLERGDDEEDVRIDSDGRVWRVAAPAVAKKGPEAKEAIEKRQAHDVDFIAHLISVNRYISGVKGTNRGMPDGEVLIGNQQVRMFAFMNSKVGSQTLREQYEEALRIIDEPVRAKKLSELDRLLSERMILTVGTPEYKTKPDADKGLAGMNADGGARGLKVVERGGRAYIE